MAMIYKIFRADEWAALERDGQTTGAPIDVQDGFIHLSGGDQVRETAALYFTDASDLVLVACNTDVFGDALEWETSRGGAKFPHVFREFRMSDVAWSEPLPLVDGVHQFPDTV